MNHLQNLGKIVTVTGTLNDNSLNTAGVDTAGYNRVAGIINVRTSAPGVLTALKLQESDTLGGSYTDIPGAALSAAGLTAGSAVGASRIVLTCNPSRKRFIRLLASATDDGNIVAELVVVTGEPYVSGVTAAEAGYTAQTIAD